MAWEVVGKCCFRLNPICGNCAFEAWEHQTFGGVVVLNERGSNLFPSYLPPYAQHTSPFYNVLYVHSENI